MYKILSLKYGTALIPWVNREYSSITRRNDLRLQKARVTYDLRKYYFTNSALNIWNSLPNHVVLPDTVNTFKSRLDKFWQHQNVIYDFKAEIHGTGNRSCYYILVLVLVIVFWNIKCGHRGIGLRSSFHYVYVYVYECRGFRFLGGPFAQAFYTELYIYILCFVFVFCLMKYNTKKENYLA